MTTTNSASVLQMTWTHSCVAIDSALNHLTVVVNGKKLEDKAFPIPAGEQPPSNLTGKLLIFKNYIVFSSGSFEDPSKISIVVTVKAKGSFLSFRVYFALVPVNYNINTMH